MARLIRSPAAKRDIVDVLTYTKERWGRQQAREYASLIEEALIAISSHPQRGKSREDICAGIFARHIAQRGRPARHIVFYRINSNGIVEIVRFLHDAMDFAQHIP